MIKTNTNKVKVMMKWIVSLLLIISAGFANSQTIDSNFVDGRIYLRTEAGSSLDLTNYDSSNVVFNALIAAYNITDIRMPFGGLNGELDRTFELTFSNWNQVETLVYELELMPEIEYAEKKTMHKISLIPNDVNPSQWYLTKVQATQAWDFSTGDAQIRIAIVDNAVSTQHEDLQDAIWENTGEIPNNGFDDDLNGFTDDFRGYDVADGDGDPNPPAAAGSGSVFTHGTHCAGIASASTNNGIGMAGLGFNTTIIPIKCSPSSSTSEGASIPNAYDGIYYAMQVDAEIISMSFGSETSTLTGESLISAASQMGIVLIAAAGNGATDAPQYPAAYQNVISVGATNSSDMITWFSNYGSTIDVMAPGANMYSTLSGTGSEYGPKSGTSMACPLVAGLAGLVLSQNPTWTPTEVELAIEAGCEPIDLLNPGYEGMLGAGRINAFNTLSGTNTIPESDLEYTVYPNPASGSIVLQTSIEPEQVRWITADGRVIETVWAEIGKGKYQLDTPQNPGVYLLRAELKNQILTERIIVH